MHLEDGRAALLRAPSRDVVREDRVAVIVAPERRPQEKLDAHEDHGSSDLVLGRRGRDDVRAVHAHAVRDRALCRVERFAPSEEVHGAFLRGHGAPRRRSD